MANGDYNDFDFSRDDDRIGIFDKKKHGNVDPKQKGKFKDTSIQSATGTPEPDDEGSEEKYIDANKQQVLLFV